MKHLTILTAFVLLLAACGGSAAEPTSPATMPSAPTPTDPVPTEPQPTEAAATAIVATEVVATEIVATEIAAETPTAVPNTPISTLTEPLTLEGADGLALAATLTRPDDDQPHPGVILLHMLGSNRQVWDNEGVSEALAGAGYTVLAVDMRGHGETGGSNDWDLAEQDLARVWDAFVALPAVDAAATAVVGGSIGGNMAFITGANEPAVVTAVLLSPGLDYRGATTDDRVPDWGDRPLLIVASQEDLYAAESSEALAALLGETAVLELYEGAGHGTNMFGREPALLPLLLEWLEMHLKPA